MSVVVNPIVREPPDVVSIFCRTSDLNWRINKFLEPYEIINFDDECAVVYSKIRASLELKGNIIGPNDYIIAATVLAKNGILVTNNVKEFKRVKNIKIENWAE